MQITMVKLTADEQTGVNEVMVLNSKKEFYEVFGEQYELCVDTPEQVAVIKNFPEELQDILTEVFHNTAVNAFWNAPLFTFNQSMLNYYIPKYGAEEGCKKIWLMNGYEA